MIDSKDRELIIAGCKSGKRKYQRKLYDAYSGVLMSICLRYSKNEAEDILQDSFVKIFKSIKNYEGKGSFEGWLKRITINTSITHYHKKNPLHQAHELEDFRDMPNSSINGDIMSSLNAAQLISIINELPDLYKITFNLYAIEGYKHHEIAELLNISEGTSKSQVSRARKMIQEKVLKLNLIEKSERYA